jgi:hypothetical protein
MDSIGSSAEEAAEELAEGEQSVNNIVYSFRLTETHFDKKQYLTYLKGYMKVRNTTSIDLFSLVNLTLMNYFV